MTSWGSVVLTMPVSETEECPVSGMGGGDGEATTDGDGMRAGERWKAAAADVEGRG